MVELVSDNHKERIGYDFLDENIMNCVQEKLIQIKCVEKDEVYFKLLILQALIDRQNIINRIKKGTIESGNLKVDDIETKINSDINIVLEEINKNFGKIIH